MSDKLYNYSAENFASNPSDENIRIDLSVASKQAEQVKFAKANTETSVIAATRAILFKT